MVMQVSQSRPGKPVAGNELFRRFGVAFIAAAKAVVEDDAGLELEHLGQFVGALLVHIYRSVPPQDGGKFAVVREQFAHLRHGDFVDVIVHVVVLRRVPLAAHLGAAVVPILRLGIIEAEFDAVFSAGGGEGLEDVPAVGRGLDDVPIARLGVEIGEAVVMFGGDDDVFHAGVTSEADPVVGGCI